MSLYLSLSTLNFYDEHTHNYVAFMFYAAPFILGKNFIFYL